MKTKLYTLTEEHRAQLKPWADRWIANAMSTKAMDDNDREKMRWAINGMYRAANLPEPKHIVFVPSPIVAAFSGSFAAAIWWLSKNGWKLPSGAQATYQATAQATYQATAQATYQATAQATDQATDQATRQATDQATYQATDQATSQATYQATRQATYQATAQATYQAQNELVRFMLLCCGGYLNMWNGGNQYSAWCSYLSFFKDVAKLGLKEYEAFQYYEAGAIHAGPRMMHPDFCIVSDRPSKLNIDDECRPHCADGPSHEWRDGTRLYYWHGVKVTAQIIEHPETLTIKQVTAEQNAEVRRIMIERMGTDKFVRESGAKLSDVDVHPLNGTRALFHSQLGTWLHCACPSTARVYWMEVPPETKTCEEADAYLRGGVTGRCVGAT